MLAAWLLLIAVVARLPSCSWEGAVTVAMNMTGFASPCATDSNSAETLRSHIAESPPRCARLRRLLAKVEVEVVSTDTRFVKQEAQDSKESQQQRVLGGR